jgi:DNA-binding winged helix-turn-helix (wHTH) protein
VIEMAARTVVVNGDRMQLPPTEFDLLAALASRPGEVIPSQELLQMVWPDSTWMTNHDLHWRIWNIRRRIGDQGREDKILENRRGVGYLVDLPPRAVEVLEGVATEPPQEGAEPDVIVLDEPLAIVEEVGAVDEPQSSGEAEILEGVATEPPQERTEPDAIVLDEPLAVVEQVGAVDEPHGSEEKAEIAPVAQPEAGEPSRAVGDDSVLSRRKLRRVPALIAAALAALLLGGSWGGGFWLSQRRAADTASPTDGVADQASVEDPEESDPDTRTEKRRADKPKKTTRPDRPRGKKAGVPVSPAAQVPLTVMPQDEAAQAAEQQPREAEERKQGSKQEAPAAPPPPQPDSQLYHLHNAETGDHYVTTNSASANQKQAAGYSAVSAERVFSYQVSGTSAISLDSGQGFIYQTASAAGEGVNVKTLYRLDKDGDFFYTSSSSAANQAQAGGWSRSTAGYVPA